MKTFKVKDLVISMEGAKKTIVITAKLRTICLPCTRIFSKISPATLCYTPTNLGGNYCTPSPICAPHTPLCMGSPACMVSPDPTWEYDFDEGTILEDIRQIRMEAVELEKAYEALLTPQTAEDIKQVESKLNEAIEYVRSLKK